MLGEFFGDRFEDKVDAKMGYVGIGNFGKASFKCRFDRSRSMLDEVAFFL